MEKLDFLIEYLLKENKNVKISGIPTNIEDKKRLYRSLCNIREASTIDDKYLKIEDEYLQEELKNKNITEEADIKTINQILTNSKEESKIANTEINLQNKIALWKGDITTLKVDAIVNAANSRGLGCFIPCHNCIDNCIHSASGIRLRLECCEKMQEIGELETGKAFITKGYNLLAKYVIHTVGPIIYNEVTPNQEKELADCYINSLKLAIQNNIKTIAFPCISTGEFRFPKDLASKIAIKTIRKFLSENYNKFNKIIFNVFSNEDYDIYLNYMSLLSQGRNEF